MWPFTKKVKEEDVKLDESKLKKEDAEILPKEKEQKLDKDFEEDVSFLRRLIRGKGK